MIGKRSALVPRFNPFRIGTYRNALINTLSQHLRAFNLVGSSKKLLELSES